ncbi:MAG TPA: class I SAM-dependent methyltransferase [Vitreimonas sp.]|nr:class I SAM-dependent methyltransferase [Vitreimonas sp.]
MKEPIVAGVTYQLMQMDPELALFDEGKWGGTESEFLAFNDAGVEMEVGEFFYSMVRLLKPNRVLETGTHWGIGAMYMGMALKHNQKGKLTTIEFLPPIFEKAKARIEQLGLGEYVENLLQDVVTYQPTEKFQFILLDTEPQTRFAEMGKFWDSLDEGGFLFIHDLHRHMHQIPNDEHGFAWPYGLVTDFMHNLVINGKARPIHFSTPRGLTGFYKVSQADYNWSRSVVQSSVPGHYHSGNNISIESSNV